MLIHVSPDTVDGIQSANINVLWINHRRAHRSQRNRLQ